MATKVSLILFSGLVSFNLRFCGTILGLIPLNFNNKDQYYEVSRFKVIYSLCLSATLCASGCFALSKVYVSYNRDFFESTQTFCVGIKMTLSWILLICSAIRANKVAQAANYTIRYNANVLGIWSRRTKMFLKLLLFSEMAYNIGKIVEYALMFTTMTYKEMTPTSKASWFILEWIPVNLCFHYETMVGIQLVVLTAHVQNLNVDLRQEIIENNQNPENLEELLKQYIYLHNVYNDFLEAHSVQLMISSFIVFLTCLMNMYFYLATSNLFDDWVLIVTILDMHRLIVFPAVGNTTVKASSEMLLAVQDALVHEFNGATEYKQKLEDFRSMLLTHPMRFSVAGIMPLDHTNIAGTISSYATLMVILLQFQSREKRAVYLE